MPLNLLVGKMRSGKSYEAMRWSVLPAIAAGRRVVTNLAGIDEEACHKWCVKHLKADPDRLGAVLVVKLDQVAESRFWPRIVAPATKHSAAKVQPGIVEPGDLLVLDECKTLFGRKDCPAYVSEFVRMMGHFAHPVTGVTCDVVLITQHQADITNDFRNVVEFMYRTKKHTALQLPWQKRQMRYVSSQYEGTMIRNFVQHWQRKYDASVFRCYRSSSAAHGVAVQTAPDARTTVWGNWRIKYGVPVFLIVMCLAGWRALAFFTGTGGAYAGPVVAPPPAVSAPGLTPAAFPASAGAPEGVLAGVGAPPPPPAAPPRAPTSSTLRLAGFMSIGPRRLVLLADPDSRLRAVPPAECSWTDDVPVSCTIDGQTVTRWSGKPATSPDAGAIASAARAISGARP